MTIPVGSFFEQVSRIKYGSSGFSEIPRGLVIENFVMHADPTNEKINGPPKVRAYCEGYI